MKWFFPDAHDANDNIGQGLQAHYDSATGRWVFPGEENAETNDPASLPPPTVDLFPGKQGGLSSGPNSGK